MSLEIFQVDAFTSTLFSGNPAAVCILPDPRDERWMQALAAEMNLSETAFVVRQGDVFGLRWFTPAVEVDLCGHATLASAHVIWQQGHLAGDETARFHTRSGLLTAVRRNDWIELDFPADPPRRGRAPEGLSAALGGVEIDWFGESRLYHFVHLSDEAVLRAVEPDFALLGRVCPVGVIVTAAHSGSEFDFVSRFFGPSVGVNEDPVTGSAHCVLGPFWQERLEREELVAYQASARGGVVRVRPAGERVKLAGQAVTVFRATLTDDGAGRA